ncbi:MBL fold metallo-hydrolase [Hahella sp. KA22]|uniref:MBL fold metallo-hydrolase n=1 Tax=Hahella sp. KA22 TaxID=1628392 RepID=UPI000FDEAFB2|nr:ribonuclease Z [Hahella sp. KA22]AZZ92431.1 ribonuclease Z [Hahella sp. KA22]QAY55805.1 MBL fold metallo-hydrolase [Hahella sp. KA22]
MLLEIIGTGEAYDRYRVNAAVLVQEQDFRLLIDCGPTVPQALWRRQLAADAIDAIYLTHIHPDHASGLTALLNQWGSAGRRQPLQILCQPGQQAHLEWMSTYAAWPEQLPFAIQWRDASLTTEIGPWTLQTAPTQHSVSNLALRLEQKGPVSHPTGSLFYSGDGRPTAASASLMRGCVMAMQECFSPMEQGEGSHHGDLPGCLRQLQSARPRHLLLYHIEDGQHTAVAESIRSRVDVSVAEDGERWCCITGAPLNARLDQQGERYAAGAG